MDSPLRAALRAATANEHRLLETQPLMRALVSFEVTPDVYRRVLAALYGFHARWEPALRAALAELKLAHPDSDYHYRESLPALRADLVALSVNPPPVEPYAGPLSDAAALGRAYVLEGASLGGRVIAPHLRRHLGVDADCGARFYHQMAAGDSWTAFCRWLAALPETLDGPHLRGAARDTFTGLHELLDKQVALSER